MRLEIGFVSSKREVDRSLWKGEVIEIGGEIMYIRKFVYICPVEDGDYDWVGFAWSRAIST